MSESLIGLIVAAITIFLTNIFSYYFAIKKEARQQAVNYKIEMLDKIYTPILKIMEEKIIPGDGYEGIEQIQFAKIEEIVNEHYNLADPKLHRILWGIKEDMRHDSNDYQAIVLIDRLYDQDRELLNFVTRCYSDLRKSIGLPYYK